MIVSSVSTAHIWGRSLSNSECGLPIIESDADRWGSDLSSTGKRTWFRLCNQFCQGLTDLLPDRILILDRDLADPVGHRRPVVRQAGTRDRIVYRVTAVRVGDSPEPPPRPPAQRWERATAKKLREPGETRAQQAAQRRRDESSGRVMTLQTGGRRLRS